MGFFTKRSSYQGGFAKYHEELQRYGQTSQDNSRNNSLNGAGAAAAAAMLRHTSQATNNPPPPPRQIPRSSSLTNARSNSLKTYTYNPKPSYQPTGTLPRRYNSLTNKPQPHHQHQHQLDDDEDYVITTKTTKVIDSQGRTQSITTKTVKTLPDGSNIIETTTKNISRSNSRSNSLRSNSLLSNSNQNINTINLSKIDEDLQDFDYNYMDDNLHLNQGPLINPQLQQQPPPPHTPPSPQELGHLRNNSSSGNNPGIKQDNIRHNSLGSNQLNMANGVNGNNKPEHVNSITSTTSSQKPLRSILKNTQKPKFDDHYVQTSPTSPPYHPYQNLVKNSPINDNESITSSGLIKFKNQVETIQIESRKSKPNRKSQISPQQHQHQQQVPKSTSTVPDADFYAAAMQAAYKKVYGDRDPNEQPKLPEKSNSSPKLLSKPFSSPSKKDKVTQAVEKVDDQGITDKNYNYENHHKSFIGHSLRDKQIPKGSKHQDRVKLEEQAKKQSLKEELKAEKQAKKEAELLERQARKDAKVSEKENKKLQKSNKKFSGFFSRKKSVDSQSHSIPTTSSPKGLTKRDVADTADSIHSSSFVRSNGNDQSELVEPKLEPPITLEHKEPTSQQPIIDSKDLNNARSPVSNNFGSPSSYNRIGRVIHSPERPKGQVFDSHDYHDSLNHRVETEATNTSSLEQRVETVNENLDKGINSEAETELYEKPATMDPGSPTVFGTLLPAAAIDHLPHVWKSNDDNLTSTTSRDSIEYVDTVSPQADENKKSIDVPSAVVADESEPITNRAETRNYGYPDANVYDVDDTIKEDVSTGLIEPQISERQSPIQGIGSDNSNNRLSIFHDASSHHLQSPIESNFSGNGLIKNEEFDKIVADSPEFLQSKEALVAVEKIEPNGQHSEITKGNVDSEISSYSNDLTRMSKHSSAYYGTPSRESYYSDGDADADTTLIQKPMSSYQTPRSEVPTVSPPELPKATSTATLPAPTQDDHLVGKNEVNLPSTMASEPHVDPQNTSKIPIESNRNTINQSENSEEASINKTDSVNEPSKNVQSPESVKSPLRYEATPPLSPPADAVESVESMENNSLVNSAKEQSTVTPQSQSQENRNHVDYPTTSPIVETKLDKPKVKKVSKFKKAILKYFVNSYDS